MNIIFTIESHYHIPPHCFTGVTKNETKGPGLISAFCDMKLVPCFLVVQFRCKITFPSFENLKVLEKNNSKSILALTCVVEIKDGVVTPRLYNIHIHTCQSSNTKAILHYYTTQVDPSPTMVNLRGERKHYCLLITDFHFSTQINFIVSELSFIRMIIYCTIIFFCF